MRGPAKIRFVVIGAWNTLFGLLVFAIADATIGREAGYAVSLTLMFALAIPQAHLAQRHLVWRSRAPYLPELYRFSWVFLVSYVVNLALLALAVEVLQTPTLGSQVVISGVIAVSTYLIHQRWTFRHSHPHEPDRAVPVGGGAPSVEGRS